VPDGPRTVVRVVCAGSLADAEWEDLYDEMEEGWRAFFQQLSYGLQRHRGEDRRTVFLAGDAAASEVLAAVDARAPGREWAASRHQRATVVERYGGGLVLVKSSRPLDADGPSRVWVLLTTYGLDDAAYADLHREWAAWWASLAKDIQVQP